ncbi:MAG: hypothetical protein ACK4TL_04480 [Hyphomicrobiaceae bacterium]
MAAAVKFERIVYRPGGTRRFLLAMAILLLLPFAASAPIMLVQRLSAGIWIGTGGLALLAVAFAIILGLLTTQFIHALRARVVLGPQTVEVTLPAGRWLTPALTYQSRTIHYEDIQAVETRGEVYGGAIAPVLMQGVSLITRDGERIPLGHVNAHCEDPALPCLSIGCEIARRAGIEVQDRGAVHRKVTRPMMGLMASVSPDKPLAPEDMARISSRHRQVMIGIAAGLVVLLGIGLAMDLAAGPPGGTAVKAGSTKK